MILLRPDCLVFETEQGDKIPCSVAEMTVELMGESLEFIDGDLVQNAAYAVLHYFKKDLGLTTVSLAEFSAELEKVLHGLGIQVQASSASDPVPDFSDSEVTPAVSIPTPNLAANPGRIAESNLAPLLGDCGELGFFPRLREELRRQLASTPRVVRFRGLRPCVKQLRGVQRWSGRCQQLHDQVIDFLRSCLSHENQKQECALIVH